MKEIEERTGAVFRYPGSNNLNPFPSPPAVICTENSNRPQSYSDHLKLTQKYQIMSILIQIKSASSTGFNINQCWAGVHVNAWYQYKI
jgi:hypothetical protein